MTLPATIRVNTMLPFPSLVTGNGPIAISKKNGIWGVGFTIDAFAEQIPPPPKWNADFILVWDHAAGVYFKMSIADLASILVPTASGSRTQRFVTSGPIVVASTDSIITCAIPGAAACTLPAAAGRVGAPLTYKDLRQATAHNITLTPASSETIDGMANYVLRNNYGYVTLMPFNDGFNTGWMVL